MKKKNKSIQKNMVLNMIRTLISIAFPLITYPYATRVLGVNNYGTISYVNSIVSYFSLFATLGITSYAIREGAIYRNDKEKFSKFGNELFSINIISTIIAYILLLFFVFIFKKSNINLMLLMISSLSIVFTTIGIEWVNVIYEDYLYITIRSFAIQIISLISLFILVKTSNDIYLYVIIQSLNVGIIAFSNLKYTRKYFFPHFTFHLNLKKHIKPILILFSNSIAVSIYLNIDNVLLGAIKGVYYVGIYSVAVKIYTILKQIVAAVYNVTITRLTEYIQNKNNEEYRNLLNNVINNIIIISIPITIGIICTSDLIVILLAGKEYLEASVPLKILAFSILFAVIGGLLAYCVNLPYKRETKNLISTFISAGINFMLNLVFIPIIGVEGAAITTLISECSVCLILFIGIRDLWKQFDFKQICINILKCVVAVLPFTFICYIVSSYIKEYILVKLIVTIIICIVEYIIINILLNNKDFKKLMNIFDFRKDLKNEEN